MNAFAQVKASYRKALDNLNNKLECLQGVFDEYEDDIASILSGRITSSENTRASATKQADDDGQGDLDFDGEQIHE